MCHQFCYEVRCAEYSAGSLVDHIFRSKREAILASGREELKKKQHKSPVFWLYNETTVGYIRRRICVLQREKIFQMGLWNDIEMMHIDTVVGAHEVPLTAFIQRVFVGITLLLVSALLSIAAAGEIDILPTSFESEIHGTTRIVLRGSRKAPVFFMPVDTVRRCANVICRVA